MNDDTCDFCEASYRRSTRHVVAVPRPSDPLELCAIMWACPTCGEEQGLPTANAVIETIEDGRPWEGTTYLFVTV